ncbi:MAG: Rossmann-fold NAD(P)-binding domain-containing protein [Acidobacteriaceae bacterium]
MAKTKTLQRTFDEVLAALGNHKFDVAPASEDAKRVGGSSAVQVRKYGCAAQIAPGPDKTVVVLGHVGYVLGGEVATLLDRGYQKFLKTSRLEVPATADALRSIHKFDEELREISGIISLYNESLGTTSDSYQYDRVKGREHTAASVDAH